ncbi:hypothetical protein MRB53_002205 [Persea americana]|uniref:Uncharacterized protein n=1 Tax=Persea americana TaxID=3435 RepID=A0ACC2MTR3_PERAE|nr:hypothetical protein MRB53_002205 [Persea americana]
MFQTVLAASSCSAASCHLLRVYSSPLLPPNQRSIPLSKQPCTAMGCCLISTSQTIPSSHLPPATCSFSFTAQRPTAPLPPEPAATLLLSFFLFPADLRSPFPRSNHCNQPCSSPLLHCSLPPTTAPAAVPIPPEFTTSKLVNSDTNKAGKTTYFDSGIFRHMYFH